MKKGFVLFLACMLIVTFACPVLYAQDTQPAATEPGEAYQMARAMLDGITGTVLFPGDTQTTISRGEFVDQTLKLFRLDSMTNTGEPVFSDVGKEHTYFGAVQAAYAMEWISAGDVFEPDRPVKRNEALKILLSAAGYQDVAGWQGGYPTGYLTLANSLSLLNSVGMLDDETITREGGVNLFYNLLNAEAIEITEIGTKTEWERGRRDYLALIYDMYMYDGIVTATTYNSLLMDAPINKNGLIAIDGEKCEYGEMGIDMLGKRVRAACHKEGNTVEVVCAYPIRNEELTVAGDDLSTINGDQAAYFDPETGDEQWIDLDGSYITIYNGRRVPKIEDGMLHDASETIRFLDNNQDGAYEIVFIDQYQYGIVSTVDFVGKTIGLQDNKKAEGAKQPIDLGTPNSHLAVSGFDGSSLELFELEQGNVVAVKQSRDLLWNEVILCDQTVSGMLNSISGDEGLMEIEGNSYPMTEYFKEQYLDSIKPGMSGTFTLGFGNAVICVDASGSGFAFGYVTGVLKQSGVSGTVQLKIFDESGKFNVYDAADKVRLDGTTRVPGSELLGSICEADGTFTPQLVRFAVNSEGQINKLDFAIEGSDATFSQTYPDEDSLIGYSFNGQSLMYKSNVQSFPGYCNVSRSIIFKIPNDLTQEDNYAIWGVGSLLNDSRHSIVAYNLDENGFAEALLIRSDAKGVTESTGSMMVERMTEAVDAEGNTGYQVYCWTSGRYVNYFLNPDTVPITKISGSTLSCGDLIRANVDGSGEIKDLVVDFDAHDAVFRPNTENGGAAFNGGNAKLMYQEGGLYSVGDGMLYMSSTVKADGAVSGDGFKELPAYDYSFSKLRNFKLNTANIVLCNRERNTVRPITLSELKSYIGYGEQEHYVILRQNAFSAEGLFVYE